MKQRSSRSGKTVFGVDGHPVNNGTLDLYVRRMYIVYVHLGGAMPKAKLFTTGGSQAVRLPAEFRFEGNEVDIRRDSVTGEVVLSKPNASWDEYFDWVRTLDIPADLLGKRDQPKDNLRDPLTRRQRD